MLPAALVGLPLFFGVQLLHAAPARLGLLRVAATFDISAVRAAWRMFVSPTAWSWRRRFWS